MKKLIFTLLFLTTVVNAQTSLYKDLTEGMSKKEAKKVIKADKDNYKVVDLGNGFKWTLRTTGLRYNEQDQLTVVYLWPYKSAITGIGYDATVNMLDHSKSFFESKGYTVLLQNKFWNAPANHDAHNFVYGLVMLSPQGDRVVHLYPSKVFTMAQELVHTAYLELMSKKQWDSYLESRKSKKLESTSNTDF